MALFFDRFLKECFHPGIEVITLNFLESSNFEIFSLLLRFSVSYLTFPLNTKNFSFFVL